MASVLSEGYASNSSSLTSLVSTYSRGLSSSSVQSLIGPEQDILRHESIRLDAKEYKKPIFTFKLLEILRKLRVPAWSSTQVSPENVKIHKVSGALTNAVFFVSSNNVPTILLRIYGPSTSSFISRIRELHTLRMLSSRYNIGPQVYGTFENGRIEEYFDSVALTPSDIRDPQISRWIAARMAEFHSVDINVMEGIAGASHEDAHGLDIVACIKTWLIHAEEVLKLPGVSRSLIRGFDLPKFKKQWLKYLAWTLGRQPTFGSKRVFAHNDAQYGNLLRLKDSDVNDEHRQIVVVDFEYSAANPAAYDIANHFHEWTTNYHGSSPHIFRPSRYPSKEERYNFYLSYIEHTPVLSEDPRLDDTCTSLMEELDKDVEIWRVASHAGGALWGIMQSRELIMSRKTRPEFDYLGYANCRMAAFREGIQRLGVAL